MVPWGRHSRLQADRYVCPRPYRGNLSFPLSNLLAVRIGKSAIRPVARTGFGAPSRDAFGWRWTLLWSDGTMICDFRFRAHHRVALRQGTTPSPSPTMYFFQPGWGRGRRRWGYVTHGPRGAARSGETLASADSESMLVLLRMEHCPGSNRDSVRPTGLGFRAFARQHNYLSPAQRARSLENGLARCGVPSVTTRTDGFRPKEVGSREGADRSDRPLARQTRGRCWFSKSSALSTVCSLAINPRHAVPDSTISSSRRILAGWDPLAAHHRGVFAHLRRACPKRLPVGKGRTRIGSSCGLPDRCGGRYTFPST